MNLSKILLFLPAFSLLLMTCSQPKAESTAETGTGTTDEPQKAQTPEPMKVSFKCTELSTMDDPDGPKTAISLVVNGKETLIDTVSSAEPFAAEDYPNYEIPKNALAACGGWFAGGGDYFYAIEENGKVVVMAGWQDEMQEDEGFHYELKQSIQ